MIIYLIKIILCSALLLLVYLLFLEKEKMHHFNRFYLLFSIVISFTIPVISLPAQAKLLPVTETITTIDYTVFNAPEVIDNNTPQPQKLITSVSRNWWPELLIYIYLSVSLILLFRFVKNFLIIAATIRQNLTVAYSGATLVLINNRLVPHSFLHYIFLNKTDYENKAIEEEIFQHELTHVYQKHSLDVLLMELLLVIFWFNLVLYFYRKAIRLNHEFLADDAVVKTFQNPVNYQQLLLLSANQPGCILPTSPFNYSITKKRLIMMTKNTSPKTAFAKQVALIPFVAALVLVFSTTVAGQQNTGKPEAPQDTTITKGKVQTPKNTDTITSSWNRFTVGSTKEGVTSKLLMEYENIIKKYETDGKWWHTISQRVSDEDRNRMETIFKQMNLEQQGKQFLLFMKPAGALPRAVPTSAQFEAFKNSKVYGVWIDGKHVSNTLLNKYTNTDFAQFSVSKLYGAAKQGRSYTHQLNMMTKDYYQNYYNQTMANRKSHIGFALNNHPVDSIKEKYKLRSTLQMEKQKIQDSMYRNPALLGMIPPGPGAYDNEMDQYNNTLKRMISTKLTIAGEIDDLSKVFLGRLARIYYRMNESQRRSVIQSTKSLISSLQQPTS